MKQINSSQVFQKNHFILFSQKQSKPTFLQCYFLQKENAKKLSSVPSSFTTITSPIETPKYNTKSPNLKMQNRSILCQEGLFVLLKSTNISTISSVQKLQKNSKSKSYLKDGTIFDKPNSQNEIAKKKQIYFDIQRYRYEHQKRLLMNNRLEEKRIKQNQRKYLSKYCSSPKLEKESFNVFRI